MSDTKEEKLATIDYGLGDLHDDSALLRRIDWRILPIMFLTYFLQFLDKVALNVYPDLHLITCTDADANGGSTLMSWACKMILG